VPQITLDAADVRILRALQDDARLTNADLASKVGLSASPCWRRVRRLAGEADFLLQVVADDLDTYAEFAMTVIRRLPGIKEMNTSFVLKEIKPLAATPVVERV
jgi:DNA-binding Lrp family transcriptional regulator